MLQHKLDNANDQIQELEKKLEEINLKNKCAALHRILEEEAGIRDTGTKTFHLFIYLFISDLFQ